MGLVVLKNALDFLSCYDSKIILRLEQCKVGGHESNTLISRAQSQALA